MAHMNEALSRLLVFVALATLLALAEWRWPRHRAQALRRRRWPVNLGLGLLDTVCLRLLSPVLAYGVAVWAGQHGIGLFNVLTLPTWLAVLVSMLVLDLLIYWQHRILHRVPWLWRLHRVHHTDLALDVSSGLRFHPLEILFSSAVKIGAVLALGAPSVSVLGFEILLSSLALFTHANLAIPVRLERVLRWLVVTPDMHRIHHSVRPDEHNRNFSFNISCWDRLFGSYRAAPRQPQSTLPLGLDDFRADTEQRFPALLTQPFRSPQT